MRLFLLLSGLALLVVALVVGLVLILPRLDADRPGAPAALLAYSGLDGNVYTVTAQGSDRQAVTQDGAPGGEVRYSFPTWSADGRLAFLRHERAGGGEATALVVTEPRRSRLRTVYQKAGSPPFYLYWSPGGEAVTFLTQEQDGIALRLAEADGGGTRILDRGSPYYWAWSPDGSSMLLHVGGTVGTTPDARIALLEAAPDQSPRIVPLSPGAFQAPAWSPDGSRILVATLERGRGGLVLTDPQAETRQPLVTHRGRIAFAWSAQGQRVAYLESGVPATYFYGRVMVLPSPGAEPIAIGDQPALAFYWSPDGERLAVLVAEPGGSEELPRPGQSERERSGAGVHPAGPVSQEEFRLAWYVSDGRSGEWDRIVAFRPSPEFVFTLPFFDQYARSMSFWSPDSRLLAFPGMVAGESTSGIWVVEAMGGARPRRIDDGTMLSWSWR